MIGQNDRSFRPIGGLVTLAGIVALGLFLSREDPKKVQANNYQPPLHPHPTSTVVASFKRGNTTVTTGPGAALGGCTDQVLLPPVDY